MLSSGPRCRPPRTRLSRRRFPPVAARRVFGAARSLEEGGSLTVIASTGLAGEPQRLATTQIVLEAGGKPADGSGTLHADRLK